MNTITKKAEHRPRCPKCGSRSTTSKGVRRTATLGDRPLRVCRKCGRKFTVQRLVARN